MSRDAPERAALERAGLKISPDVNRHDGQGTASISAEFLNAYLELMWPDPTVSVAPGAERGAFGCVATNDNPDMIEFQFRRRGRAHKRRG